MKLNKLIVGLCILIMLASFVAAQEETYIIVKPKQTPDPEITEGVTGDKTKLGTMKGNLDDMEQTFSTLPTGNELEELKRIAAGDNLEGNYADNKAVLDELGISEEEFRKLQEEAGIDSTEGGDEGTSPWKYAAAIVGLLLVFGGYKVVRKPRVVGQKIKDMGNYVFDSRPGRFVRRQGRGIADAIGTIGKKKDFKIDTGLETLKKLEKLEEEKFEELEKKAKEKEQLLIYNYLYVTEFRFINENHWNKITKEAYLEIMAKGGKIIVTGVHNIDQLLSKSLKRRGRERYENEIIETWRNSNEGYRIGPLPIPHNLKQIKQKNEEIIYSLNFIRSAIKRLIKEITDSHVDIRSLMLDNFSEKEVEAVESWTKVIDSGIFRRYKALEEVIEGLGRQIQQSVNQEANQNVFNSINRVMEKLLGSSPTQKGWLTEQNSSSSHEYYSIAMQQTVLAGIEVAVKSKRDRDQVKDDVKSALNRLHGMSSVMIEKFNGGNNKEGRDYEVKNYEMLAELNHQINLLIDKVIGIKKEEKAKIVELFDSFQIILIILKIGQSIKQKHISPEDYQGYINIAKQKKIDLKNIELLLKDEFIEYRLDKYHTYFYWKIVSIDNEKIVLNRCTFGKQASTRVNDEINVDEIEKELKEKYQLVAEDIKLVHNDKIGGRYRIEWYSPYHDNETTYIVVLDHERREVKGVQYVDIYGPSKDIKMIVINNTKFRVLEKDFGVAAGAGVRPSATTGQQPPQSDAQQPIPSQASEDLYGPPRGGYANVRQELEGLILRLEKKRPVIDKAIQTSSNNVFFKMMSDSFPKLIQEIKNELNKTEEEMEEDIGELRNKANALLNLRTSNESGTEEDFIHKPVEKKVELETDEEVDDLKKEVKAIQTVLDINAKEADAAGKSNLVGRLTLAINDADTILKILNKKKANLTEDDKRKIKELYNYIIIFQEGSGQVGDDLLHE